MINKNYPSVFIVLIISVSMSLAMIPALTRVEASKTIDELEVIRTQREKNIYDSHSQKLIESKGNRATGNCNIVYTIQAPDDDSEGIAWDAGNLWVVEGDQASNNEGTIFHIDTSGNILSSFSAPGESDLGPAPKGLASDGTYLWCLDYLDDKIYKLAVTGEVVSSISLGSGGIYSGLAWDGTYLWAAEWFDSIIYKIDPSDGQILDSLNAPDWEDGEYPYGLAWDGTYLWVSNSEGIYKIDPDTGSILSECHGEDVKYGKAYSLTWDGEYLWAGSWLSDEIIKIDVSDLGGGGSDDQSGLTATPDDESVTLSWNSVPDAPDATYKVYIAITICDDFTLVTETPVTETTYIVTGLTNGITYCFYVTYIIDDAEFEWSDTVSVQVGETQTADEGVTNCFSGTWEGTYTITRVFEGIETCTELEEGSITISLCQEGDTVSGGCTNYNATNELISGDESLCAPSIVAEGEDWLFQGSVSNSNSCTLDGSGYFLGDACDTLTATVSGDSMTGSFTGTSMFSTKEGTFLVTKTGSADCGTESGEENGSDVGGSGGGGGG
jgi:hypothetical protein